MYYQNYEDYMRSVLGYPVKNQDTYKTIASQEPNYSSMRRQDLNNLEEYYPEIYKEINPLVCKVCNDSRKENRESNPNFKICTTIVQSSQPFR